MTGTLTKLDLERGQGAVETDTGTSVAFTISKPELFEKLSSGSRVTLRIDKAGRVDKVTDESVSDFVPSIDKAP
ncbi:hypothetical protein W02_41240 [Nitrospira sp. KM1]|nr:hypothetical protein W02_41240 [Nitrospira sp. KM1]